MLFVVHSNGKWECLGTLNFDLNRQCRVVAPIRIEIAKVDSHPPKGNEFAVSWPRIIVDVGKYAIPFDISCGNLNQGQARDDEKDDGQRTRDDLQSHSIRHRGNRQQADCGTHRVGKYVRP